MDAVAPLAGSDSLDRDRRVWTGSAEEATAWLTVSLLAATRRALRPWNSARLRDRFEPIDGDFHEVLGTPYGDPRR